MGEMTKMAELKELENKAKEIVEMTDLNGRIWSKFRVKGPISVNVDGKNSSEIMNEIEQIKKEDEEIKKKIDLKSKVLELKKLKDEKNYDLSRTKEILQEICSNGDYLGLNREKAFELYPKYQGKLLSENNLKNPDEIQEKIRELDSEEERLGGKFLGKLRFRKELKNIDNEITKLYGISGKCNKIERYADKTGTDFYTEESLAYIYENARPILDHTFKEIISDYNSLIDSPAKTKLDENIIKSLNDEFAKKYFEEHLSEKISNLENYKEAYKNDALKILKDKKLVKEAFSVLKEGLNRDMNLYNSGSYAVGEEEKVKALRNRFEELPYEMHFIEYGMNRGHDGGANKVFNGLASTVMDKKRILDSVNRTAEIFKKSHIVGSANETEKIRLKLEEMLDIEKIDMEKWEVFKENNEIKKIIGENELKSFHNYLRDKVFENLLVIPDHNDRSIKLGYKALKFKDADLVPYVIMNSWRETGYSGEYPFLCIHESPKGKLGVKYILSLDKKKLKEIENLKIPGLSELINQVRKNPDKFKMYGDEEEVTNLKSALGEICRHYIKNGNKNEKYFALSTAVHTFRGNKDESSKIIDILADGMSNEQKEKLKENYEKVNERLSSKTGDEKLDIRIGDCKEDLVSLNGYFNELDNLMKENPNNPEFAEKAKKIESHIFYKDNFARACKYGTGYLKASFSKEVRDMKKNKDEDYIGIINQRLENLEGKILSGIDAYGAKEIDNIQEMIVSDLNRLDVAIKDVSENVLGKANNPETKKILEKALKCVLNNRGYLESENGIQDSDRELLKLYLGALNDEKIINKINSQSDISLFRFAETLYHSDKELISPIVKGVVAKNAYPEINRLSNFISETNQKKGFIGQCLKLNDQNRIFNAIYGFSQISPNTVDEVNEGKIGLESILDSIETLDKSNLKITDYLVRKLHGSSDKEKEIESWQEAMKSFDEGKFDANNQLHRNLEYTRFKKIVDNEKIQRHVKNNFTYSEYEGIFNKKSECQELPEKDKFEVKCAAYEAKLLKDYIMKVNGQAKKLGKKTVVIPNFSYGYLPTSPIIEELSSEGIEVLIGAKVGSTESHDNKEVMNSRLFKGYRSKIINEQPMIVVVDGTQHLVSRDNNAKSARYPDAYQGYLNQMIAINDGLNLNNDYSKAGKTEEDMARLRNTPEFTRTVGIYKELAEKNETRKPYSFGFWNTANIDLIIRNYHQKLMEVTPANPEEMNNPAMIFCNVGVLDNQIPSQVREGYDGEHVPAYFDDSGKIINFDFDYDNQGVRYLNRLETEVKKAYCNSFSSKNNADIVSSLIKYVKEKGYERKSEDALV
jgi:hypothetical protein